MDKKRIETIRRLREKGETQASIARKLNISHQRISQLLHPKPRRTPIIMTNRKTCYICRCALNPQKNELKFCEKCRRTNALNVGGRDFTRGLVRGRDNNTCQSCGKVWTSGRRFDVHHLKGQCGKKTRSYDDAASTHSLITVCHKCHYNLHDHRAYGKDIDRHLIHI